MFKTIAFRHRLAAASAAGVLALPTVHAQVCPFDNGGSTLENDGLVLTRYALGLRGAPMLANTSFAVADAPTIESNIACPSCGLRVTDDKDALNNPIFTVADATIISRKIAGFSGPALTNGIASLGSGTRNSAAAVQSFLLAGCGAVNAWVQGGNAFGAPGVIGTTDGQPLTVGTGLGDGLRIKRSSSTVINEFQRSVNVVNGSRDNFVDGNAQSATVAGGGGVQSPGTLNELSQANRAFSSGSTVSGGLGNIAGTARSNISSLRQYATVGGGKENYATGQSATVSGGEFNRATDNHSSVLGGESNEATYRYATVVGGRSNRATAVGSAVLGGEYNQATGDESAVLGGYGNIAAGAGSVALGNVGTASDPGEFVWNSGVSAWNPKALGAWGGDTRFTFNVRADRGIYFQTGGNVQCTLAAGGTGWNCASDRALKEKIIAITPRTVLEKVASLPISTWVIKGYEQLHMGPMAQDFRAAFGLGRDDKTINTTDAQGVALAAIQGLNQKLTEQGKQITAKDDAIARLTARLASIEKRLGFK